jgi:lipid A disaccharide synthetase
MKLAVKVVDEVSRRVIDQMISQFLMRKALPKIHQNLPIVTKETFKQADLSLAKSGTKAR